MSALFKDNFAAELRRTLFPHEQPLGDGLLLEAFLSRRDQAAFSNLVSRHGPMVLGVCRRILAHAQDAEDAFQAVFVILARKAETIRPPDKVGNWLYGVSVRVALKARGRRSSVREKQAAEMPSIVAQPIPPWSDLRPILDEEIERLPIKYREAVVLCELEGRARREAAQFLDIAEGTLSSRLASARKMLAKRLSARGVTLTSAATASLLAADTGIAAVPMTLAIQTWKLATLPAAEFLAAVSPRISDLAQGVIVAMFLSKMKAVAVVVAALGLIAFGAWWHHAMFSGTPASQLRPQVEQAIAKGDDRAQPKGGGDMAGFGGLGGGLAGGGAPFPPEDPDAPKLTKAQVRFLGINGAKIRLFETKDDKIVPARFTFDKPGVYRFKIHGIPGRPGVCYYPMLEIPETNDLRRIRLLENAYLTVNLDPDLFDEIENGVVATRVFQLATTQRGPRVEIVEDPNGDATPDALAIFRCGGIDLENNPERVPPRNEAADRDEKKDDGK